MGALKSLLLLQYNNYFNRAIFRPSKTLETYREITERNKTLTGINFNPNDGVETEQIINWTEDWTPDYLVVVGDVYSPTEQGFLVESSWFVIEATRTRGKQYLLKLKRDVIADHYSQVMESPCYIEKGWINDSRNNLIFNSEGMSYNQIKIDEQKIRDKTGCAWLVGYVAKNKTPSQATVNIETTVEIPSIDIGTTIDSWSYYNYSNLAGAGQENFKYDLNGVLMKICININSPSSIYWYQFQTDEPFSVNTVLTSGTSSINMGHRGGSTQRKQFLDQYFLYTEDVWRAIEDKVGKDLDIHTPTQYNSLFYFKDKVIKTSDSKYYKVQFEYLEDMTFENQDINAASNSATTGDYTMRELKSLSSTYGIFFDNSTYIGSDVHRIAKYSQLKIVLTELIHLEVIAKLSATRNRTKDAVYDMFCLPYNPDGDVILDNTNNILLPTSVKSSNQLAIAQALAAENGGGGNNATIYDLQILPYCPIPELYGDADVKLPSPSFLNKLYSTVEDSGHVVRGIIFYPNNASFSTEIQSDYDLYSEIPHRTDDDILNIKISNEVDIYRLVSPNYNGQFEYSLAKNGGMRYFNVDCTYRPFNPFIHVSPNFGKLYGYDFGDNRGLVCNGDFSVGMFGDQFATYELQNKNYQNIFDRQIQNMEVQHSIQNTKSVMGIVGTLLGSSLAAGLADTFSKTPALGVTTAVAGGIGGTIMGGVNYGLLQKQQVEQKSYATDMYNFNLQNIQALPYSLTKTGAFVQTNKYFPFWEHYQCSREEIESLKNKIKYNGMTINVIGRIMDYKGEYNYHNPNLIDKLKFVKGQMIRIEGISEDSHLFNAIYEEIAKGVYL